MTGVRAVQDPFEGGETVDRFAALGVFAGTTGRAVGSFGTLSNEPVGDVMGRWSLLRQSLETRGIRRLATATQVHGDTILRHDGVWRGWLRGEAADGHWSPARGTGMAVTVADCVPVFLAHPSGAAAALHSGWRGTAAGVTRKAIGMFADAGCPAAEVVMHCGPAICGACYEVSPDVHWQLTGRAVEQKTCVDLRALIAGAARAAGVRDISLSAQCTRCDGDRFYSHRAGDAGRQLGVLAALP